MKAARKYAPAVRASSNCALYFEVPWTIIQNDEAGAAARRSCLSTVAAVDCRRAAGHLYARCRADPVRALRAVPPAGWRRAVQPDYLRRRAATREPDRPGHAIAVHAAVETRVGRAFVGDRRLTGAQIATLERWASGDAGEGDRADLPPPPRLTSGWQSGPPDLVLALPEYAVRADGPDIFRNFVVSVPGAARATCAASSSGRAARPSTTRISASIRHPRRGGSTTPIRSLAMKA